MTDEIADVIKHREIGFRGPHPDARQAHSATLLLHDVDGIMHVKPLDDMRIAVSYDLRKLTLAELEAALQEIGFHLDNGVLYKLKRALYEYTETVQRENLGLDRPACTGDCAQKLFIKQYRDRRHGCQDDRPEHWRRYL